MQSMRFLRHWVKVVGGFLLLILLGTAIAGATSITYNVNRGAGIGSISGFIETDGTIGAIAAGNIVDWSLLLNDGTTAYDLYSPVSGNNSSVDSNGSHITATSTQLLFNFSGTDNGYFRFQYGVGIHNGNHYCGNASFSGICLTGETIAPGNYTQGGFAAQSRDVVIAMALPEPSSLVLLGGGLLAAVFAFRRKYMR